MIKYGDILNMIVTSTQEGKCLGRISKMAVDMKKRKVVGFVLEEDNKEEKVIRIQEVTAYGKDSVMVSSKSSLKTVCELSGVAEAAAFGRKIIGLRIVTDRGENIGEVESFYFNEKTGVITHYEVSGGLLPNLIDGKGLLPKEGVVALGEDALVVIKAAAVVSGEMKAGPGLKHMATRLKVRVKKDVAATAKDIKKIAGKISGLFCKKSVPSKGKAPRG